MGQQLAPLAEQTSIPRIVDAFLKRGNKVLEQDARFARELVWFDAVVRQKWGQWAAQFLFCERGDQVWGGSVEFMLR